MRVLVIRRRVVAALACALVAAGMFSAVNHPAIAGSDGGGHCGGVRQKRLGRHCKQLARDNVRISETEVRRKRVCPGSKKRSHSYARRDNDLCRQNNCK